MMIDTEDRFKSSPPATQSSPCPESDVAGKSREGQARSPASTRMPVSKARMERWKREEPALILAWQQEGSNEALTVLLKRYQPFFRSQVSKILAGRSVSQAHRTDLEQEASLAFVQAVSRFDFFAGTPLSALAGNYIRNALLRYSLDFRHSYRIGTSSDERKAYYAALSRRAERIHKGESETLTEDDITTIRSRTGASEKAVRRAVDAIYAHTTSMESALDVEAERNEQAETDIQMSIDRALEVLAPFVAELDARKSEIFRQFASHGEVDGHALAERFDITPERIGQIRREMLSEMAGYLRERGIEAEDLF